MQGYQAYKQSTISNWTRIDMLLAIYDGTLASLDAGIDALNRGDQAAFARHQIKTTRLLILLLDGVNPDGSEVARNVRDLCVYCVEQVTTPVVEQWVHARDILATLQEGFAGIREEAIQLEANGEFPELTQTTGQTVWL